MGSFEGRVLGWVGAPTKYTTFERMRRLIRSGIACCPRTTDDDADTHNTTRQAQKQCKPPSREPAIALPPTSNSTTQQKHNVSLPRIRAWISSSEYSPPLAPSAKPVQNCSK